MQKRAGNRGGGGGGSGGGKKGGGGGAKKSGPVGPSVSWKGLLASTALMCQMVGHSDEDMSDQCLECAGRISSFLTKKPTHENKMDFIESVNEAIDSFMVTLSTLPKEKAEEVELAKLLKALYDSSFEVLRETLEDCGSGESESKAELDAEEEASGLLSLIDTLLGTTVVQSSTIPKEVFKPHFKPLAQLAIDLGMNKNRDAELREGAFRLLGMLIEALPSQIAEESLTQVIIDTCYTLCADPDSVEEEEEEDEEDVSKFPSENVGTQTLDQLANSFSSDSDRTAFASIVLSKSLSVFTSSSSSKFDRKSAVLTLAVLPESCSVFCSAPSKLDDILNKILLPALTDAEAIVRSSAFVAVSEFIEHTFTALKENIKKLHDIILKTVTDEKEDMITRVKACIPLNQICEHITAEELGLTSSSSSSSSSASSSLSSSSSGSRSILTPLLSLLSGLLSDVSSLSSLQSEFLESIVICVRTIAASHRQAIEDASVSSALLTILLRIMKLSSPQLLDARGHASSAVGEVAAAIGADAFLSHIDAVKDSLTEAMELTSTASDKNYQLRANVHATWAQIALVLKDKFVPYLSTVMPDVLKTLELTYGMKGSKFNRQGEEGEEDEEEEEEEDEELTEEEMEEVEEERKFALLLYKACIEATGAAFLPFADFEVLDQNAREYHDETRPAVAAVFGSVPLLFTKSDSPAPAPGSTPVYDEKFKSILKAAKQTLLFFIHFGTEQEGVDAALTALIKIINLTGQTILVDTPNSLKAVVTLATSILQGRALSQLNEATSLDELVQGPDELLEEMGVQRRGDDDEEGEGDEGDDEDDEAGASAGGSRRRRLPAVSGSDTSASSIVEAAAIPVPVPHVHSDSCSHDDDDSDSSSKSDGIEGSAFELLVAIAKSRGPLFADQLGGLWPLIASTFDDPSYHAHTVGCAADMIVAAFPNHMKHEDRSPVEQAKLTEYIATVMRAANKELSSDALTTKASSSSSSSSSSDASSAVTVTAGRWATIRCSAYAAGTLFLKADSSIMSQYTADTFKGLEAWIERANKAKSAHDSTTSSAAAHLEFVLGSRDNLVSALGKMLMTSTFASSSSSSSSSESASAISLPLATAIPIFLGGLPIEDDFDEASFAYSACIKLLSTPSTVAIISAPANEHLLVQLLDAFIAVILPSSEAAKANITAKLQSFVSSSGLPQLFNLKNEAVKKHFEAKPDAVKEKIQKLLTNTQNQEVKP